MKLVGYRLYLDLVDRYGIPSCVDMEFLTRFEWAEAKVFFLVGKGSDGLGVAFNKIMPFYLIKEREDGFVRHTYFDIDGREMEV